MLRPATDEAGDPPAAPERQHGRPYPGPSLRDEPTRRPHTGRATGCDAGTARGLGGRRAAGRARRSRRRDRRRRGWDSPPRSAGGCAPPEPPPYRRNPVRTVPAEPRPSRRHPPQSRCSAPERGRSSRGCDDLPARARGQTACAARRPRRGALACPPAGRPPQQRRARAIRRRRGPRRLGAPARPSTAPAAATRSRA